MNRASTGADWAGSGAEVGGACTSTAVSLRWNGDSITWQATDIVVGLRPSVGVVTLTTAVSVGVFTITVVITGD